MQSYFKPKSECSYELKQNSVLDLWLYGVTEMISQFLKVFTCFRIAKYLIEWYKCNKFNKSNA